MGGASAAQGLITSAFNAFQANKQERFQERMSNTSHQREVADLRKAGLNPILSAKLGGASTPTGSSAQASSPDIARSAAQGAAIKADIENTQANTALAHAQAGDVNATQRQRIDLMIAQKRQALQSADATDFGKLKTAEEIKNLESQKKKIDLESSHSALDLDRAKAESKFHKGAGGFMAPWTKTLTPWK